MVAIWSFGEEIVLENVVVGLQCLLPVSARSPHGPRLNSDIRWIDWHQKAASATGGKTDGSVVD